ncbi:hypothetical protein C350_03464 [Cryptococcus neoformans MW-RSA36]|nr:hypothetical protein C350_03464 [Cryptococcus neoformans var. grubii MW-RSA36]
MKVEEGPEDCTDL